jgi:hypothetical protein
MSEIQSSRSRDGREPRPSDDAPITAEFARKRAARAIGEINTSVNWQVRIEWTSPKPMTWPPFSYDAKRTREDAVYCAQHALRWRATESDLCVVGACVRAPGASEWEPVSLAPTVSA